MKILKQILRIILGIIFTCSGFLKAVDPHGSEYIFTDYFVDAFGLPSLVPLSFALAIILSAFEFLVGICLLANVKPRLSSLGALIFMIIFTPVTLYIAITNSVTDCGCFGDAIKLTNWETFFKNLVLLPIAIFVFIKTKGESNTYKGKLDWILASFFMIVILVFEYYNLAHLPVIDFMPYKVGTYIPDKMIIPATEKPDSFSVFYKMKQIKTGEVKEMSDAEFLKRWNDGDTLWQPIGDGVSKLVRSGYKPPISNFKAYPINIYDLGVQSQTDVMKSILDDNKYSFLVISYDISKASVKGFQNMTDLLNYANTKDIRTHFLTASTSDLNKLLKYISFPAVFYNSDPVTLKTVIRSNPGLVLLKKGKIIGKWHYNDVPTIKEFDLIIKQK